MLRKVSRGKKGWYCLSSTREYPLARISVTSVTVAYYVTCRAAHGVSSIILAETVEHMESSVTPWWVALSLVFLALAMLVSLFHRSFFMMLATWLGGGYCSFALMCLCGKFGALVADSFLARELQIHMRTAETPTRRTAIPLTCTGCPRSYTTTRTALGISSIWQGIPLFIRKKTAASASPSIPVKYPVLVRIPVRGIFIGIEKKVRRESVCAIKTPPGSLGNPWTRRFDNLCDLI